MGLKGAAGNRHRWYTQDPRETTEKNETTMTPRNAVLYCRVSSKEQEKEGFSIPAQEKLLNKYASENGFRVLSQYVDVETAKRVGRTGFVEMVTFLRQNPQCRQVIVEKTDRLYRNFKDYVTLDEINGLEIHFVKEGTVVSPDSRSSEKFIHGIKVLMAKNYIDNLSEETRKGMTEKAEQGMWPSYAPIGYLNAEGPSGKRVIVPDPDLAPFTNSALQGAIPPRNWHRLRAQNT
jgi:site-specific DNA recombinase